MAKPRIFISFDYDHDEILKTFLIGQAHNEGSPFDFADWSIKEAINTNWKAKARERIRAVDVVCVICGEHTITATGVAAELKIAQEEGVPYFLLRGYGNKTCERPTTAKVTDKMYAWTWPHIAALVKGGR